MNSKCADGVVFLSTFFCFGVFTSVISHLEHHRPFPFFLRTCSMLWYREQAQYLLGRAKRAEFGFPVSVQSGCASVVVLSLHVKYF